MITRRNFIRNLALAGIGLPVVQVVSPFEPSASSATINPQYMAQGCLRFLGVTETPIRDGEPTKDLQQSEMGILRKEAQQDGCTINSLGECFVVAHGKYLCFWRRWGASNGNP